VEDKETVLRAFETFEKQTGAKAPAWIRSVRKEALSRFIQLDFPTLRDEEWKYTSVEAIVKNSYRFNFESERDGLSIEKLSSFLIGRSKWPRLVFINGIYCKELSSPPKSSKGLLVASLWEAFSAGSDMIESHLAREADFNGNIFTALNTAFLQDGALILLRKGEVLEDPVHLLFVSPSRGEKVISQPRNLVLLEEGSRASVIESYVSPGEDPYFTNAVTEVHLSQGAGLQHCKIQQESRSAFHVATTEVSLDQASSLTSHSISTGARVARNNLNVSLKGEGASCLLNGLYLVRGTQHTDHHTVIDHILPHGTSRQNYKGILNDKSRAVFNGKIFVRRDAQKTDAHQTNKNLLLSQGATADTKPQLEIDADDVKCTHGAAVGALDEAMIFYVKSRGLDETGARDLLTYGFATEITGEVKIEPLRSHLDQLVWKFLERESRTEVTAQ